MKLLVIGNGNIEKYTSDKSELQKYEIIQLPRGTSDAQVLSTAGDAELLLVDAITPVSGELIRQMPNLKVIHSQGVAFDKIDIETARAQHVYVCNCKGMNAGAVAEQAVLLMLGLLRNVAAGDAYMRAGRQMEIKEGYMKNGSLRELGECTVGLIGFGDIAKATAKLASAFGARVLYYSRTRASQEVEQACGAAYLPLAELLPVCDIVSLHLPVTEQTVHFADSAFLQQMKQGAYLINTARGELVDESALLDAIRIGHLAGAGLDTVTGEPVQKSAPIFQAEDAVEGKILYSCHIGGITGASFRRGYEMIWADFAKAASGQAPDHVVNPW